MKKFLWLLIFTISPYGVSFAQTEKIVCPTVIVTSGGSAPATGEPATFTASVSGISEKTEYFRSIDHGKIIEGQGTPTITVERKNEPVTAEVEIKGLPKECPRTTASDMTLELEPIPPILIDEYPLTFTDVKTVELNNLGEDFRNDPDSNILISIEVKMASSAVRKYIEKVFNYLSQNLQIPKGKIYFQIEKGENEIVRHFRIPSGGEFPGCDKCELIRGDELSE